jgi:hypothetical protein
VVKEVDQAIAELNKRMELRHAHMSPQRLLLSGVPLAKIPGLLKEEDERVEREIAKWRRRQFRKQLIEDAKAVNDSEESWHREMT